MTSIHENVSCDSCRKNNFRGLRYKCLVCYDYDLCSTCYEAGLTSTRHTVSHPMQCIITKNDYELFYAGETITSDHPQSLTCPLCGSLGFTEASLLEHVTNEHASTDNDESCAGVVCPICGVETNQLTYEFAAHLTVEHRTPRDPIEQVTMRGRGGRCHARATGPRGRRSQPHYAVGGPTNISASTRDSTDPLVEILAQLSGVRRAGAGSSQSPASHLHQLQMHLQSSPSFTSRAASDREVRIMRRTFQSMNNQMNSSSTSTSAAGPSGGSYSTTNTHYCGSQPFVLMDQNSLGTPMVNSSAGGSGPVGSLGPVDGPTNCSSNNTTTVGCDTSRNMSSQYLLTRCLEPILTETEQQQKEILKADRSLFVQELLLQIGLLENANLQV